jgi:hypothetical protein
MLEHLTPEQKLRMHCLAMAVHCNEEVTGEMPFIIGDAASAYDFVMQGATKPASEVAPIGDTMAKIADAVLPAGIAPLSDPYTARDLALPKSNVFRMADPGESQFLGDPKPSPATDPEPTPERKPRGPSKAALAKAAKEAKKAERAKRKAEKAATKDSDTATVSEGEKDAPVANGAGEHTSPMPVDEPQPVAA